MSIDKIKDFLESPKPNQPPAVKPSENGKLPKTAKGGRNYVPNGVGRGGDRGGRKPLKSETVIARGVRELLDEHFAGKEMIKVTDPKSGQSRMIEKPRSLIIIEKIFRKAFNDDDLSAMKEWLDRAVGKSAQPIRGDEADDTPIRLEYDISKILEKVYEPESN